MAIVKIDILNHADYAGEFREHDNSPGLSKFYTAIESVRSLNRDHTSLPCHMIRLMLSPAW